MERPSFTTPAQRARRQVRSRRAAWLTALVAGLGAVAAARSAAAAPPMEGNRPWTAPAAPLWQPATVGPAAGVSAAPQWRSLPLNPAGPPLWSPPQARSAESVPIWRPR